MKIDLQNSGWFRCPKTYKVLSVLILIVVFVVLGFQYCNRILWGRGTMQSTQLQGEVRVVTFPIGATVILGDSENKNTPAIFKNQKPGDHLLKIHLENYEPVELHVNVKRNQNIDLGNIVMVRSKGNLQISTQPQGLEFEVWGEMIERRKGITPLKINDLPTGLYFIKLKQVGWLPHQEEVRVGRNVTASVFWEFGPATKLTDTLKQQLEVHGKDLVARGEYEAAAEQYQFILDANPKDSLAFSNLGVVRLNQGKLEEAEASLKAALALDPKDAFSLTLIGVVHGRKKQYDQAILDFTNALDLNPDNPEAHCQLGIICMKKNILETAEKELMKAVTLRPNYGEAHYNLALVFANQRPQSVELARRHYKRAREIGVGQDDELEKMLIK